MTAAAAICRTARGRFRLVEWRLYRADAVRFACRRCGGRSWTCVGPSWRKTHSNSAATTERSGGGGT